MPTPYTINAGLKFTVTSASIRPVVDDLRKTLSSKSIDIPINLKLDKNASSLLSAQNTQFKAINRTLNAMSAAAIKASVGMKQLGMSIHNVQSLLSGAAHGISNLSSAANTLNRVNKAISTTGNSAKKSQAHIASFYESVGIAVRRFSTFALAAGTIAGLAVEIRDATKAAFEFEREMVRLKQVGETNKVAIKGIADEITKLATTYGASSGELAKTAVSLRQAGLSATETRKALSSLAKTTVSPTFDNLASTTEGAIAIMAQFKQGAGALESQLGSLSKVSADTAAESSDLVEAVKRAGGAWRAAGGDLEHLFATFASIRANTRESAESIATGLRTILARLQDPAVDKKLKTFGIDLRDFQGKFIGPTEAAKALAKALEGLDTRDVKFTGILKEIGGLRQLSRSLPFITEVAAAEKNYQSALKGRTTLQDDAKIAQEAFLTSVNRLKEGFLELFRVIASDTTLRMFLDSTVNLLGVLNKALIDLKPLIPILTVFAGIKISQGFFGGLSDIRKGFSNHKTFSTGGGVPNAPGGGFSMGTDTVPAMLTPGEFVIPKGVAQKIGYGKLQRLISPTGYASGGRVKRLQSLLDEIGIPIQAGNFVQSELTIPNYEHPGTFSTATGLSIHRDRSDVAARLHEFGHAIDYNLPRYINKKYDPDSYIALSQIKSKHNRFANLYKKYQGYGETPFDHIAGLREYDIEDWDTEAFANGFATHSIASGMKQGVISGRDYPRVYELSRENNKHFNKADELFHSSIIPTASNVQYKDIFPPRGYELRGTRATEFKALRKIRGYASGGRVDYGRSFNDYFHLPEVLESQPRYQKLKGKYGPDTARSLFLDQTKIDHLKTAYPRDEQATAFYKHGMRLRIEDSKIARLGLDPDKLPGSMKGYYLSKLKGSSAPTGEYSPSSTTMIKTMSPAKVGLLGGLMSLFQRRSKGGPIRDKFGRFISSGQKRKRNSKGQFISDQEERITNRANLEADKAILAYKPPYKQLTGPPPLLPVPAHQLQLPNLTTSLSQLPSPNPTLQLPSPSIPLPNNSPVIRLSDQSPYSRRQKQLLSPISEDDIRSFNVNKLGRYPQANPQHKVIEGNNRILVKRPRVIEAPYDLSPHREIQDSRIPLPELQRPSIDVGQSPQYSPGGTFAKSPTFIKPNLESGIEYPLVNPNPIAQIPDNGNLPNRGQTEKSIFAQTHRNGKKLTRREPINIPYTTPQNVDTYGVQSRYNKTGREDLALQHFGHYTSTADQIQPTPIGPYPQSKTNKAFQSIKDFFKGVKKDEVGLESQTKIGAFASSKFKGVGGKLASFGKIGLTAGLIAAPTIAEKFLGTASKPGSAGIGGAKVGSVLGGAVSGGAIGAFTGAQIAGPYGAVVGGLVGALSEVTGSLDRFEEELEKVEIEKFGKQLDDAVKHFDTKTASFNSPEAERSFYDAIDKGKYKLPKNKHIQETSAHNEIYGKPNTFGAEEMGFFETRMNQFQKFLQNGFGQENPETIRQEGVERENKQRDRDQPYAEALGRKIQDTREANKNLPKEEIEKKTVKYFSKLAGLGPIGSEITQELKKEFPLRDKVNKALAESAQAYQLTIAELEDFSAKLENASNQFNVRSKYNDLGSNALNGNLTATPNDVTIGNLSGKVPREINDFSKVGGGFDQAKTELDKIVAEVGKSANDLTKGGLAADEISRRFEKTDVGQTKYGQEIIKHIGAAVPDDLQNKVLGGQSKSVVDAILSPVKPIKETGDAANKQLQEIAAHRAEQDIQNKNRLYQLDIQRANTAKEREEGRITKKTFDNDLQGVIGIQDTKIGSVYSQPSNKYARTPVKLGNKQTVFGKPTQPKRLYDLFYSRGVSSEERNINEEFNQKQTAFGKSQEAIGVRSDSTADSLVSGIQAKQSRLTELSRQHRAAIQSGQPIEEVDKLGAAISSTEDDIRRFTTALSNLANNTNALDASQKQYNLLLNKAKGDLESRKSDADIITFGSQQEKQQLFQKEALTQQALQLSPGEFQDLPDQVRKIVGERLKEAPDRVRTFEQYDARGRYRGIRDVSGEEQTQELRRPFLEQSTGKSKRSRFDNLWLNPIFTNGARAGERLRNGANAAGEDVNKEKDKLAVIQGKAQNVQKEDINRKQILDVQSFSNFITDLNKGVVQQIEATQKFLDSSAQLTKSLKEFKGDLTITRNGTVEVVINGMQVLQAMKGDLEKEILNTVIGKLQEEIKKQVEKVPAR